MSTEDFFFLAGKVEIVLIYFDHDSEEERCNYVEIREHSCTVARAGRGSEISTQACISPVCQLGVAGLETIFKTAKTLLVERPRSEVVDK